jgi:hypothetical protein
VEHQLCLSLAGKPKSFGKLLAIGREWYRNRSATMARDLRNQIAPSIGVFAYAVTVSCCVLRNE